VRCAVFDHLGSAVDFDPADPPEGFQPDFPHFCQILSGLERELRPQITAGSVPADLVVVLSWIDRPWRADFGPHTVVLYVGRETPRVPTHLAEAWLAFSNMARTPALSALATWPGDVRFALALAARLGVNAAAYAASRRHLRAPYLDVPIGRMNPASVPWVEPEARRTDVNFIGSVIPGGRRRQRLGPKAHGRRVAVAGAEAARAALPGLGFDLEVLRVFGQRAEGYMERMADARVVLCPVGSHTETSRFEEALSVGAVPVLFPPPRRSCFVDHPGVELADWGRLHAVLDALFDDRDALHQRMRSCREFYEQRLAPAAVAREMAAAIRATAASV
jgi:hypothetical protein